MATAAITSDARPAKGLHIALWIAQVLLAVAFGMAGFMKATAPLDELVKNIDWASSLPGLVRFIGVAELAGAIGLVLPAATRIRPALTPLAAAALALVMVLATLFHMVRGEMTALPITLALGALAAFVAWGRFRKAPIAPRS